MDAPRIAPLEEADWNEEARAILSRWNPPFNIHKVLAHSPATLKNWVVFGNHILFDNLMGAREREIAICRVAWNCQSDYEWGQHSRVALKCGVTQEELIAICTGPGAPSWDARDRAILQAVDDIQRDWEIGEEAWAELARHYDEATLIDFVFVTCQFILVSVVLKTFRVPLDEGLQGLPEIT